MSAGVAHTKFGSLVIVYNWFFRHRLKTRPDVKLLMSSVNATCQTVSVIVQWLSNHGLIITILELINWCQWNDELSASTVQCWISSIMWAPLVLCSQESPRKRVGMSAERRLPEVKAIQQTRRLLANARERTRVHTISAAFEALRKQVRLSLHMHSTYSTCTSTHSAHKHCRDKQKMWFSVTLQRVYFIIHRRQFATFKVIYLQYNDKTNTVPSKNRWNNQNNQECKS